MTTPLSTPLARFHHAWRADRSAARASGLRGAAIFLLLLAFAVYTSDFNPLRLIAGLPRIGEFLGGLVPPLAWGTLATDLGEWYWGLGKWLGLLWITLMMALCGTVLGTLAGGCLSLLAASNLGTPRLLRIGVRRFLEIARTVPDLVWALVFLFAFGLGPLSGVLAIILHTLGAQGKLFAEVNENADLRPLEGVRAAGGTWLDAVAVGLLPQVLPNFVSYTLWRFEINVRSATIIGFVGAGGIGMELYDALSLNYFDDAGAILLIVFVAVSLIDMVSESVRLRLAFGSGGLHD